MATLDTAVDSLLTATTALQEGTGLLAQAYDALANHSHDLPVASSATAGVVKKATDADIVVGTNDDKFVTPKQVSDALMNYDCADTFVISEPVLTGSTTVAIGYNASLTVSAASKLVNGSIVKFTWKLGSATGTVNASNSTATLSVAIPSATPANSTLALSIIAIDNLGNKRSVDKTLTAVAAHTNIPSVTAPANNTTGSALKPTITVSAFSNTGPSDTAAASQIQISTSSAFSTIAAQHDGGYTTSFTPTANLGLQTAYYVRVRHKGTRFGWSDWSTVTKFTTTGVTITAPTFTSPAQGTEVFYNDITVVVSGFATSPSGLATHSATSWKLTSDAVGNSVIQSSTSDTSNLTSFTFTEDAGEAGATVYAWAKFHSSIGVDSAWVSRSYVVKRADDLDTGRSIYRHSSGKGSVLIYEDGTEILVLDAQYRAKSKEWEDAISYCEGLSVDGQACSCPDKDVLLDIWEDQDAIDARDPTITSYATFALSNWGFGSSHGTYVWSSTPHDSSYAYFVDSSGNVSYGYRFSGYGVVPVLEL